MRYQLLDALTLAASNWTRRGGGGGGPVSAAAETELKGSSVQLPYRLYNVLKCLLAFGGIYLTLDGLEMSESLSICFTLIHLLS